MLLRRAACGWSLLEASRAGRQGYDRRRGLGVRGREQGYWLKADDAELVRTSRLQNEPSARLCGKAERRTSRCCMRPAHKQPFQTPGPTSPDARDAVARTRRAESRRRLEGRSQCCRSDLMAGQYSRSGNPRAFEKVRRSKRNTQTGKVGSIRSLFFRLRRSRRERELLEVFNRHGAREQVALDHVAARLLEVRSLLRSLHPFRDQL